MNNLAKIRDLRGLNQYELAAGVGLSQTRMWKMEHGHEVPSLEMQQKLADLLQVEVADLFSDSEKDLTLRYDNLEKEHNRIAIRKILSNWKNVLRHRGKKP